MRLTCSVPACSVLSSEFARSSARPCKGKGATECLVQQESATLHCLVLCRTSPCAAHAPCAADRAARCAVQNDSHMYVPLNTTIQPRAQDVHSSSLGL